MIFSGNMYFSLLSMRTILVFGALALHLVTTAHSQLDRKDTLKLVQVVFRHGDRSPTNMYPKDPYVDEFDKLWPEGFAQLTNLGKLQQYELGQFLRKRYDGFLAKKYSPSEIFTTASDMDRTIMSLESNLAGLFPPVVDPWNPQIDWQPIPLRTIPWKEDKILHNNVRCPKYYQLRSDFYFSSEVVQKMNQENQDFIRYCAQNSGLDITTVKGLYPLLDILYAQASHNYTLPEWAQGDTLPKLLELHGYVNTWPTYTDEMKRLWGGPFLHLLLQNMKAIAGHAAARVDDTIHSVHKGVDRKMLMYSAHDSTLERIMNTMGVFEPHCPPYASALIIELHQDNATMDYYIEIHYRNDTTREPYFLNHPNCSHPCKLQKYIEVTRPVIPLNWEKECHVDSSVSPFTFFTNFNLKLGEHDEDQDEDTESTSPWDPTEHSTCYPSSLQLVLLGLGLMVSSTFTSLIVVKLLRCRNGTKSYFRGNIIDDSYESRRPMLDNMEK